ncbi:MAG: restriction endonuclease subunit S [Gammaproteobacteria bacterium]|nr:restriction endonuclease subunit S [Gammaproteobacteria bacterium]
MTDRDPSIGPDGLTRRDRDLIREMLARYPEVRRVTLFGSRAMGTFGRGSDIDLALEGPDLDARTLTRIATELEDSDLPYKVDLLLRDDQLDPKLEAHIQRHGKLFGWEVTTLSDVSTDIAYGYTQSADSEKVGPHFLRITDIQNGTVDWSTVPYCPINASDYAKYKLKSGDIVVARTGNSTGENYIFRANEDVVFASYLIRFRIDPAQADPLFVWYWMRTPAWWSFVNNSKTGSAQAGANAKILGSYQFTLPPIYEQRAIAGVLGALDDKIEQNRRTARALERLARAIFRAWFVDFEPVKAKAAGATAFPSMPQPVFDALPTRFVDSAIGPVPEGWDMKALSECVHLTMGQSPPSEYYNVAGDGLPFHQGVTDYGFRFPAHRVYCTAEGRIAEPLDVLLSVRAPVGRINVADRRLVLGRGLAGVRHLSGRQSFLLYQLAHVFVEDDAVGDGTIYKAVTKQFLSAMPLLSPAENVQAAFETIARPLDDLVALSEIESRKLAAMRDYLLPKLLSGAICVDVGSDGRRPPATAKRTR